jgi:hypothetical protein
MGDIAPAFLTMEEIATWTAKSKSPGRGRALKISIFCCRQAAARNALFFLVRG